MLLTSPIIARRCLYSLTRNFATIIPMMAPIAVAICFPDTGYSILYVFVQENYLKRCDRVDRLWQSFTKAYMSLGTVHRALMSEVLYKPLFLSESAGHACLGSPVLLAGRSLHYLCSFSSSLPSMNNNAINLHPAGVDLGIGNIQTFQATPCRSNERIACNIYRSIELHLHLHLNKWNDAFYSLSSGILPMVGVLILNWLTAGKHQSAIAFAYD